MIAKQTLSASLVVLLATSAPALAEPEPDVLQPPGEVQPKPADPPGTPTMKMRKPTGTFQVGAGYSTDEGFLFSAAVEQTSLFGTGKYLGLLATVGERRQDFRVRYDDPSLLGSQLRLRGDLYMTRKRFSTFTREAVGGELTLARRIAPGLDVFAGYKLEHVKVEHDPMLSARIVDPMMPIGGAPDRPWTGGLIGAVKAGVQYSSLDQPHYPRRGTKVGASIELADRQLGSDIDYLRTDAWLAHHRPIGPFTLHLAGRVSSISDVPLSERLHFDGSSAIRGYAPGALMPSGGNLMWTGRAELEAPLCEHFSIAGFVDAGGLYTHDAFAEGLSTGVGVIWRSPIGPLRFDVAYPIDGGGPRYIFGIGAMF